MCVPITYIYCIKHRQNFNSRTVHTVGRDRNSIVTINCGNIEFHVGNTRCNSFKIQVNVEQ